MFGTRKISLKISRLFKNGLINVHRGDSYYYRGLDSDLWPLYHNDFSKIGVTIHMIDNNLDTGPLIYKRKIKIDKKTRTHNIQYHTTLLATKLVVKTLKDYHNNKLRIYKQKKIGKYYSFMPQVLKELITKKFDKYCKKQ